MSPEDFLKIDMMIQAHVFGRQEIGPAGSKRHPIPPYSSDADQTNKVETFMLDEVIGQGDDIVHNVIVGPRGDRYSANFGSTEATEVVAPNRPLAVCLAALKFLNVDYDKKYEKG